MKNQYIPDYVVHPGEILAEYASGCGLTLAELSARLGVEPAELEGILQCRAAIPAGMALRLEAVFGRSATFWNTLQQHYDAAVGERQAGIGTTQRADFNPMSVGLSG